MNLAGKTIKHLVDLGYDGQALIFTDGTAALFQGTGYETDGCSVAESTEIDVIHVEALAEDERRDSRERNRRAKARYEAGEMKGLELVMYETIQAGYLQMVEDANRQLVGVSAAVPIAKSKARRS